MLVYGREVLGRSAAVDHSSVPGKRRQVSNAFSAKNENWTVANSKVERNIQTESFSRRISCCCQSLLSTYEKQVTLQVTKACHSSASRRVPSLRIQIRRQQDRPQVIKTGSLCEDKNASIYAGERSTCPQKLVCRGTRQPRPPNLKTSSPNEKSAGIQPGCN